MKPSQSIVRLQSNAVFKSIFVSVMFLSLAFRPLAASSQALTLAGENFLLLNGERFKSQKFSFTKAEGDWYATASDAHGTITLFGSYDGRPLRFDMEWDGKKDVYPVNAENRHRTREAEFILTAPDKAVYGDGINAYPSGEDEVRIVVQHVDALSVSGLITGTITQGNEKVDVKGAFNLKRAVAAKNAVTASYKNCDNVVHDKLSGAQNRSPSECEAAYDLDVRTGIRDALTPVLQRFESDWNVLNQTTLEPLTGVGRHSEKDIFNTVYELSLRASRSSVLYSSYQKQLDAYSEKLETPSKGSAAQFATFGREMRNGLTVNISISVNNRGAHLANFKGGAKVTKLSSQVYLIQSHYVQATTGGDENESLDASFLFIGNWRAPVIQKSGDGGESVSVSAVLDPSASHLQAQNIFIRIEANEENAKAVIDHLDITKLEALLSK